jgi:hypothetical protein
MCLDSHAAQYRGGQSPGRDNNFKYSLQVRNTNGFALQTILRNLGFQMYDAGA